MAGGMARPIDAGDDLALLSGLAPREAATTPQRVPASPAVVCGGGRDAGAGSWSMPGDARGRPTGSYEPATTPLPPPASPAVGAVIDAPGPSPGQAHEEHRGVRAGHARVAASSAAGPGAAPTGGVPRGRRRPPADGRAPHCHAGVVLRARRRPIDGGRLPPRSLCMQSPKRQGLLPKKAATLCPRSRRSLARPA